MSDRHNVSLSIPFGSPHLAHLALSVLSVDPILRREAVTRVLSTSGCLLLASFTAVSVRQARVAVDHFLGDVQLVASTVEAFDPNGTQGKDQKDAEGL
ncbi:MAG: hypothetical protein CYPHOPRED_005503, partial [Cyphobasidiales sp. Tagirdzhanova-0007]